MAENDLEKRLARIEQKLDRALKLLEAGPRPDPPSVDHRNTKVMSRRRAEELGVDLPDLEPPAAPVTGPADIRASLPRRKDLDE